MSEAPTSKNDPATTPRPRGRRRSTLHLTEGAFFHGLGLLVIIYVTGLLSLLGDYRVELYLLGGIIAGALGFPLLGVAIRRRLPRPLVWGSLIAFALTLALYVANTLDPLVTDADLFLRAVACTATGVPVAIMVLPRTEGPTTVRRTVQRALLLGLGPIIMGIGYSLLYAALGFGGFPYLVLLTEAFAGALLLLEIMAGVRSKGRSAADVSGGTVGARAPGAASTDVAPPSTILSAASRARDDRRAAGVAWAPPRRHPGLRLSALLVVGLALVLALPGLSNPVPEPRNGVASASEAQGAPVTRTPIQHIITIMLENRAFDSFFGLYPALGPGTVRYAPNVTPPVNLWNSTLHWTCTTGTVAECSPSGLEFLPNGTFSNPNPLEGYSPYHIDWDHGKMDGWLAPGGSGSAGLATYTAEQMAPEWVMAQEYALGDAYFASMLSETTPNRLYALAGYSPVMNDYGPPPYVPLDQTILGELSSHGVSWGYYLKDPSAGTGTLNLISGLDPNNPGIQTWDAFHQELDGGTLPAVSWLLPTDGGLSDEYSQGPPGNVLQGEMWLLYWVDQIERSPEWNSTAIVLTYDEGGGMYDHVAPPALDGEQLGQRIPLIVLSPYAKEDYVSHTVMNHASWLGFIDYNWEMPALNTFVADSNLPLDLFDFQQAPRAPLLLTASEGFPVPAALPFDLPSSPDLARLFPQPFQENLSTLPYALTGSSSTTLSSFGGSVWVTAPQGYTPWYLSVPVLSSIFLVEIVVWIGRPQIVGRLRARGPKQPESRSHHDQAGP